MEYYWSPISTASKQFCLSSAIWNIDKRALCAFLSISCKEKHKLLEMAFESSAQSCFSVCMC